jgi:plastocyanin/mono/diheme cytochrome c family protein
MNTSKQINIMVALVFLAVVATGAYTLWDPDRASDAREAQLEATVERAAFLFSQNCAVCHGDAGEGGAASNRLRVAPPLDRADLQGIDPETNEFSQQLKDQQYKFIYNTIECGRVGKSMPTWGQEHGGTLNNEQIRQLTVLITEGTGWEHAAEYARHGDPENLHEGYATDPYHLAEALDDSSTTVVLDRVEGLAAGIRLEVGDELMVIVEDGVDEEANSVEVERGLLTTDAEAHDAGAEVVTPFVPPDPAPITQPACGQNLPADGGGEEPPPVTANPEIISLGTAFNTSLLSVPAGTPITLTHDNQDAGIAHNIHFQQGADPGGETVAMTDIEVGPVVQTLNFGPLEPGEYYYVCDVHPGQMEGVLTAFAEGEGPAGGNGNGATAADDNAAPDPGTADGTEGDPIDETAP